MYTVFKLVLRLILVVAVLSGVGCASVAPKNEIVQAQWQGSLVSGLFTTRDKPLLQEHKGVMYQVRYAAEDTLVSHNFQTGKDALIAGAPGDAHLAGVSAYSDDQNIYAAWRHKLAVDSKQGLGKNGDKMVYVAHSSNGETFSPATRISTGNGAFMPVLSGNKSGDVYAVWQDERSGGNYDLYFNVSHDHGATWKQKDVRLDVDKEGESFSAEPFLRADGNWVWLTWVEAGKNGCAVYVRASDDRGDNWRDAVEVAKCGANQALFPHLVRSKGRLMVYWFDAKTVKASASADGGSTWAPAATVAEVGADGVTMQDLTVKEDASGAVHLIFGRKGDAKNANTNLYYLKAEDGEHFSAPVRLNSGDEYRDSAILPTIAFDTKQGVMVVWTDYRFFRSVVVGAYSADRGTTWSHDFLMGSGTENATSQFPHLSAKGDEWWVSMVSYIGAESTKMGQGQTVVNRIDPMAKGILAVSHGVADTSTLKARVSAWWDTRLKADWAGSYDLMDPFMRSKNSKPGYIASQGMVTYYAYEFVGFEMNGERQATVKVKYTSEVPEMVINGRKISVPKQEMETIQDWIYVDGNWYCLFKDLFGNNFREL